MTRPDDTRGMEDEAKNLEEQKRLQISVKKTKEKKSG
jgi:hypothetical protein